MHKWEYKFSRHAFITCSLLSFSLSWVGNLLRGILNWSGATRFSNFFIYFNFEPFCLLIKSVLLTREQVETWLIGFMPSPPVFLSIPFNKLPWFCSVLTRSKCWFPFVSLWFISRCSLNSGSNSVVTLKSHLSQQYWRKAEKMFSFSSSFSIWKITTHIIILGIIIQVKISYIGFIFRFECILKPKHFKKQSSLSSFLLT